jgi:hypothetical protein
MVLTAREWGWSPTALIRGAKNPHKHHWSDYAFAFAVKTLEEEKCPRCGLSIWHAYSEDNRFTFECEDVTCYSCQHKEEEEERERENNKGSASKGTTKMVRLVPEKGFEDTPMPSRAGFYEKARQKAMAKMAAAENGVTM